jgi:hypothetical protein
METENGKELTAPRAELGPRPHNQRTTQSRIRSMAPRPTVSAPCSMRGHHALAGRGGTAETSSPTAEPRQGLALYELRGTVSPPSRFLWPRAHQIGGTTRRHGERGARMGRPGHEGNGPGPRRTVTFLFNLIFFEKA